MFVFLLSQPQKVLVDPKQSRFEKWEWKIRELAEIIFFFLNLFYSSLLEYRQWLSKNARLILALEKTDLGIKLIRFDDFLCLMLTAKSMHNNFFTIKIGLQYSTFCRFFSLNCACFFTANVVRLDRRFKFGTIEFLTDAKFAMFMFSFHK